MLLQICLVLATLWLPLQVSDLRTVNERLQREQKSLVSELSAFKASMQSGEVVAAAGSSAPSGGSRLQTSLISLAAMEKLQVRMFKAAINIAGALLNLHTLLRAYTIRNEQGSAFTFCSPLGDKRRLSSAALYDHCHRIWSVVAMKPCRKWRALSGSLKGPAATGSLNDRHWRWVKQLYSVHAQQKS